MIQIKPPVIFSKVTCTLLRSHLKGNKIAVICSNSVWSLSYIKEELDLLSDYCDVKLFRHLRPDAPFEDLNLIKSEYEGESPDTIIGIGGGSVIDACKALSVLFTEISIEDLFYKRKELPSTSIHMLAVPTTAGTGAELSFGAIVYDNVNNVKGGIRGEVLQPNAVFIDVDLYKTAPPKLIAEVGFDCLTHALETYISIKSDPLIKYQSISAIQTVLDNLKLAVNGDGDALSKMAIASTMMGINLAYSSTCLPHRIQYVIGPMTGNSHAQGLIALYNGWMQLIGEDKRKSGLAEMERDLGGRYNLIDTVNRLKVDLDIDYTISSQGISSDQIEKITAKVKGSVGNDPCYVDRNTIIKILNNSL